jgi:hypothetical protein
VFSHPGKAADSKVDTEEEKKAGSTVDDLLSGAIDQTKTARAGQTRRLEPRRGLESRSRPNLLDGKKDGEAK